jgi:hypothetical protein
VVSQTERLIYEHLRCVPIGMLEDELAHELAVLISPYLPEQESE